MLKNNLLHFEGSATLVILFDGGGSNSSSHIIVKQDIMDLANKLGIRLLMVHYPPYCSKFNPIEHRLFSQITRSWSGAPLMSLQNAADRAAMTTTKKGLEVHVSLTLKHMTSSDRLKNRTRRDLPGRSSSLRNLDNGTTSSNQPTDATYFLHIT